MKNTPKNDMVEITIQLTIEDIHATTGGLMAVQEAFLMHYESMGKEAAEGMIYLGRLVGYLLPDAKQLRDGIA